MSASRSIEHVCARSWRLVRLDDLTPGRRRIPIGYHVLEFRQSTSIDPNGGDTAVIVASLDGGLTGVVDIDEQRMIFTSWINTLSGSRGFRNQWVLDADRSASAQDAQLVCRVLAGQVSWTSTSESLSFTKPDVGSLELVHKLVPRD
jgi:hypothetical protein